MNLFFYFCITLFFHNAFANPYPIDVEINPLWIDVKKAIRERMAEGDFQFRLKSSDLSFDLSSNGYEHYLKVITPKQKNKQERNDTYNKEVWIKESNKKILYITLPTTSTKLQSESMCEIDGCIFCLKFDSLESSKDVLEQIINSANMIKPIPVLGVIIFDEIEEDYFEDIKADSSLFE